MSLTTPETFKAEERELLSRYFTNLDGPVFALVNLPEVVKGALFARYSRSPKSLRRLFLDEFVGDLDVTGDTSLDATVGLKRAEELYERVFSEYGDDSVAQLGGVHLACEQSSNLLTKVLERGRLMAYLEQSTRYIPYDNRLDNGHYRYIRDPVILDSPLGARYVGEMDRMFDTYGELLPVLQEFVQRRSPIADGVSAFAHRAAVRATCLDALRGLLPAGCLSNVGIYGSGQGYEQLLLRMRAHPLPEARYYAELMIEELRKVIPSFLTRLERAERGGVWVDYLRQNDEATSRVVDALWPRGVPQPGTSVRLTSYDPDGEDRVLAAICYEHSNLPEAELLVRVAQLSAEERSRLLGAYVGERGNRRHHPGRAYEATSYRFDVVCDYGAFRDLQRHRLLTIEWQPLGTDLGYEVPELIGEAGLADRYVESLERSRALHDSLARYFPEQCAYAVALAYNVRFYMEMNAREAMHLIELRSTPQGHPAYRRVATDMYRLIAEEAGHRDIAASMSFVDLGVTDLGRLDAEQRAEARAGGRHSQANADAERGEGGGGSRTLRALSPRPPAG
ncbi:MAG: FAD-dependent thymidylate synthase [Acidimicrobiales bacterium]|jgi:thymidylate synthase ThyX